MPYGFYHMDILRNGFQKEILKGVLTISAMIGCLQNIPTDKSDIEEMVKNAELSLRGIVQNRKKDDAGEYSQHLQT